MAFQTSALPGFVAATSEMWPSMSNAMAVPWRVMAQRNQGTPHSSAQIVQERRIHHSAPVPSSIPSTRIELPECLRDLPPSFSTGLSPRNIPQTPFNIRHTLAALPKNALSASNPIARRAFGFSQTRNMSTAFRPWFQKPDSIAKLVFEQRKLISTGASQSILAHLEDTASKNSKSATSQYAFYSALMRANMPEIIVERYESGLYATNSSCEALYHRALGAVSQSNIVSSASPNKFSGQTSGSLQDRQLQAIGQAVAASSRGANVSTSKKAGKDSEGVTNEPLTVVVGESIGNTIFKWCKMLLYFGLFTYISFVAISVLLESLQGVRKVSAKADNEAKAEHQTVKFSDVHGCDEATEELQELVEFLKNPEKFSTLGGKLPKGVLLVGPPGTGKTLLARAVAGEAGVPFFFMSGSEFEEVFVGVGAKRVRELFNAAKAKAPAIVFIDELDAIGGKRNARDPSYAKQTLNQLLTELDGFDQNSGVIIIAATNFPESLDKALTRPGRFDRNVVVGLPDVRGRIAILKHHMKKIIASPDVSLETIAAGTPGFSGAELENVINQAAVHASKAKAKAVSMLDFEWAKDKVMMGAEKKSMVINQHEKEMTAYHEAGHALAIMFTPGTNQLHKITIMPRGQALGVTSHLPEMDKYSKGKDEYHASIDVCMGGKVAEELVYGPEKVTSGAASDIEQATAIAYHMVTRCGMSDKLGNVDLASNHEQLSAGTKQLIESEVRRFIEESRVRVAKLLDDKRKELDYLAKALVDYETLNKDEAFRAIKGEKLDGREIVPSGSIKVPPMSPGESGGIPVPDIPGSQPPAQTGSPEPPAGGAVA